MCVALQLLQLGIVHPSASHLRITHLPGQPQVEFQQFSGYVTVDDRNQQALFFYFAEAEKDAASKPLVLWLNGGAPHSLFLVNRSFQSDKIFFFEIWKLMLCVVVASCWFEGPGCSSLGVGAFSENGPFRPKGEALVRNQFSWNRGTYLSS